RGTTSVRVAAGERLEHALPLRAAPCPRHMNCSSSLYPPPAAFITPRDCESTQDLCLSTVAPRERKIFVRLPVALSRRRIGTVRQFRTRKVEPRVPPIPASRHHRRTLRGARAPARKLWRDHDVRPPIHHLDHERGDANFG